MSAFRKPGSRTVTGWIPSIFSPHNHNHKKLTLCSLCPSLVGIPFSKLKYNSIKPFFHILLVNTEWRTKCHTIDCARNTFLLLQKHLTSGTELILIGWEVVPNEEHVQCDHRFASQPLANEPFIRHNFSAQVFRKRAAQLHYVGPELRYIF
jgi:hypothetical protein